MISVAFGLQGLEWQTQLAPHTPMFTQSFLSVFAKGKRERETSPHLLIRPPIFSD